MIEFVSCKRFWWWCSSFLHWRVKHRNESLPLLAPVFFRFRRLYWRRESFPSLCLSFFLIFFLFLFSFLLSYFLNGYIIYWCINVSSAEIRLEKKIGMLPLFTGFISFFVSSFFSISLLMFDFRLLRKFYHSGSRKQFRTQPPAPTPRCFVWLDQFHFWCSWISWNTSSGLLLL